MPNDPKAPSTRNRVVLLDWTADNNPTTRGPDPFIWELIILSLLYDEILIQDNMLLSSRKLAEWFAGDQFRLIEELIDAGVLVVLKRPIYPTAELNELAVARPMLATARFIEQHSVLRNGSGVAFSPQQEDFQQRLDSCLRSHPTSHRAAGEKRNFSIFQEFASLLREVLRNRDYEKWRQAVFPGITGEMAEEFVKYTFDPEMAVQRIRDNGDKGKKPACVIEDGKLILNCSLADQVATTFPKESQQSMQRLVESTFAAPFCWGEQSNGGYGKWVHELVLVPEGADSGQKAERIVRPEAMTRAPIPLPDLPSAFGGTIAEVRRSDSGKALRLAFANIGKQPTFADQEEAWEAVAYEMARRITKPSAEKATVWSVCGHVAGHLLTGALVEVPWRCEPGQHSIDIWGQRLLAQALAAGGPYVYELIRRDLKTQTITSGLKKAVTFRVVDVPRIFPHEPFEQIVTR